MDKQFKINQILETVSQTIPNRTFLTIEDWLFANGIDGIEMLNEADEVTIDSLFKVVVEDFILP